jgi:hypothetical protein
MPGLTRLVIWFCGLLFSASTLATPLTTESYGFPLTNPFEATIAGTPAPLRPDLPLEDDIHQSDYYIKLRPERAFLLPDNFWAVRKMGYRLARQSGRAPLVFVLAGTGAHYSSGTSEYLKQLFYGAGYHVVQLSSPTSYDFMAAASRNATPGISRDDAEDLYRAMQAVRAQHPDLKVSDFYLTGFSLGALNAAFVSQLDETRRSFNFKRVLLLNPPVNLYNSISTLDRLVQVQVKGINSTTNFYEVVLGKLTRYFRQQGHINLSEAMLYDFQQSKQRLSNEEMAMLIGAVFRFAAADIAFTSDLINRRGLITPPNFPMDASTSLTPFFKRAQQCDFECYMNDQLLPLWLKNHPDGKLEQLVHDISLYSLEAYLHDSPKIAVMHNADDPILNTGDLGFLRTTFGDRMTLYPHGGHGGNLNYKVNAQAMLEFFHD